MHIILPIKWSLSEWNATVERRGLFHLEENQTMLEGHDRISLKCPLSVPKAYLKWWPTCPRMMLSGEMICSTMKTQCKPVLVLFTLVLKLGDLFFCFWVSLNLSPFPSAARLIIFCTRALLLKSSIILFWPYWGTYPSQQKGSLYHREAVREVDGFRYCWERIALTSLIHTAVPGASTYMAQNAATTTSSAAKTIMCSEWWSKRQDLDLLCWEAEGERPIFCLKRKKNLL